MTTSLDHLKDCVVFFVVWALHHGPNAPFERLLDWVNQCRIASSRNPRVDIRFDNNDTFSHPLVVLALSATSLGTLQALVQQGWARPRPPEPHEPWSNNWLHLHHL